MQLVDLERREQIGGANRRLALAMHARSRSIETALGFVRLVEAIKRRDFLGVGRVAIKNPRAIALLWMPLSKRLKQLGRGGRVQVANRRRQVCILSRQRVVGKTNGSSVYLLDLVETLARTGFDVHFLSPSPATLGRWPYLALRDEMQVFRTVRVRGTWRIGRFIVAVNPWNFVQGLLAVLERRALGAGVIPRPILSAAAYAVASPLAREDQLYLAEYAPRCGDILIADYCYMTEAFPYALRPDAKTFVIMHDLFSSRAHQFAKLASSDSAKELSEAEECALLAKADAIIAIQKDEGRFLQNRIPHREIVVAPMAAKPVECPSPETVTSYYL